MKATVWKGETFGVRIGVENAKAYFQQSWKTIEVEIEGIVHSFKLSPKFWTSCPEFRGKEITRWLTRRGIASWPKGKPPVLVLTPVGEKRFRLSVANAPTQHSDSTSACCATRNMPGSAIPEPEWAFLKLRGIAKEIFSSLGGGEAFVRKEREQFYPPSFHAEDNY